MNEIPFVKFENEVKMPMLGFGTWRIKEKKAVESVKYALQIGYRHIDTAAIYYNEQYVGEGIKSSGIPRKDVFLVSKLWNAEQGYESSLKAFDISLKKLATDYLDLYLIHWPQPLSKETWKAFEKLYKEGKVKSIGVSNFHKHHLIDLMSDCEIKPFVNQIEFHPRLVQQDLLEYCKKNKIQYEAWSPLMQGKIFSIPLLQQLAEKYNRSIAQIVLRWDIQMGVVSIPKSENPGRIKSNMQIFDFEISKEDIEKITQLDNGFRVGEDPDNFDF
jgi:diketogulonate reductase-like aldo/keto reductase